MRVRRGLEPQEPRVFSTSLLVILEVMLSSPGLDSNTGNNVDQSEPPADFIERQKYNP